MGCQEGATEDQAQRMPFATVSLNYFEAAWSVEGCDVGVAGRGGAKAGRGAKLGGAGRRMDVVR